MSLIEAWPVEQGHGQMARFENIPVNIISGFLGAGKTTAIQNLLQHRPESQRWAVIVNEFGQVGIDGALLENDSVEIKEIPGGCLCCVGSQSLNVGLNQVIRQLKPDRILLEPTGLGHPEKLLESLNGEFYRSVLDLRAVINIVDARQFADERYMQNETFIAQIQSADVLVANKLDSYTEDDRERFYDFALNCNPAKKKVAMVEQGVFLPEWLDIEHSFTGVVKSSLHHEHAHAENVNCDINVNDWFMVEGRANSYSSVGWKVKKSFVFSYEKLSSWLANLFNNTDIERVKGVIQTDSGWVTVNYTRYEYALLKRQQHKASILEIIASGQLPGSVLDDQLKLLTIEK